MSKATPRPLFLHDSGDLTHQFQWLVCKGDVNVVVARFQNKKDAEMMVRAVNCHDDFIDFAENFMIWHPESKAVIAKLQDLLKRARGES